MNSKIFKKVKEIDNLFYMRCFYCGRQGHIKKKCWKYELHIAV